MPKNLKKNKLNTGHSASILNKFLKIRWIHLLLVLIVILINTTQVSFRYVTRTAANIRRARAENPPYSFEKKQDRDALIFYFIAFMFHASSLLLTSGIYLYKVVVSPRMRKNQKNKKSEVDQAIESHEEEKYPPKTERQTPPNSHKHQSIPILYFNPKDDKIITNFVKVNPMAATRKSSHVTNKELIPLLTKNLVDPYRRNLIPYQEIDQEIESKLTQIEELLAHLDQNISLNDKLKHLLAAKKIIIEIIKVTENPAGNIILASILCHEAQLNSDPQLQRTLIQEAVEAYSKVLTAAARSKIRLSETQLLQGILLAKLGNKVQAKKNLDEVYRHAPEYLASISIYVIQEYILPLWEGSDSISDLSGRIFVLRILLNQKKIKSINRYALRLEHDVVQLMSICRISDVPAWSSSPYEFETFFINYSDNHKRNLKVLKNRIELLCTIIHSYNKNFSMELAKARSLLPREQYKSKLKKDLIEYSTLSADPIPNLDAVDTDLILSLLQDETDPYIVLQKVHLKGDNKTDIISALVEVNKGLKTLQEEKAEGSSTKQADHKNKITRHKTIILDLEALLIGILNTEIDALSEELDKTPKEEKTNNYILKIEGILKKLLSIQDKMLNFQLTPRETRRFINTEKLIKHYQQLLLLIKHFKQDIEKGLITSNDISFINLYRQRQEKIHFDRDQNYKLEKEHYPNILLYKKAGDLLRNRSYAEAILALKEVIATDPKNCFAYNDLAECYRALNRFNEALEAYQASLSIYPTTTAYINLAFFNTGSAGGNIPLSSKYIAFGICLIPLQKEDLFDRKDFQLIDSLFRHDKINIKSTIEAATLVLRKNNYLEAFKLFSIAIWRGKFEKDEHRQLVLERMFCLSFIVTDDPVELTILQHDWAEISAQLLAGKFNESNHDKLVKIADNLLKKPLFKSFADLILATIKPRLAESDVLAPGINRPSISDSHQAQLNTAEKKSDFQSLELSPTSESEKETKDPVVPSSPVDLTPLPLSNARQIRNLLQRERDEKEIADQKAREQQLIADVANEQLRLRAMQHANKQQMSIGKKIKKTAKKNNPPKDKKNPTPQNKGNSSHIASPPTTLSANSIISLLLSKEDKTVPLSPREKNPEETIEVELPLNMVRRLHFILNTLGKDKACIIGGLVEKMFLGKPYDFDRDIDIVTNVRPKQFIGNLPELVLSKNDSDKNTYVWQASRALNIPRVEIFVRKFLLTDHKYRNFISKTLRIIGMQVADGLVIDIPPSDQDRERMVKVKMTVSGLPEAFQSIKDKKLRLPPGITAEESFKVDASRILQAVNSCCKDGYSDEELDLKSHIYRIGELISANRNTKPFRDLKKIIADVFRCGESAKIWQRWIELGIIQYLFKDLSKEIPETLRFIQPILESQDKFNRENPTDKQLNYSLIAIIAYALYYQHNGQLSAESLITKISDYLEKNIVFTEFNLARNLIKLFISGPEKVSQGEKRPPTLFDRLRADFKLIFSDASKTEIKEEAQEHTPSSLQLAAANQLQQDYASHQRALYLQQQRFLFFTQQHPPIILMPPVYPALNIPLGYSLLEVPDPDKFKRVAKGGK